MSILLPLPCSYLESKLNILDFALPNRTICISQNVIVRLYLKMAWNYKIFFWALLRFLWNVFHILIAFVVRYYFHATWNLTQYPSIIGVNQDCFHRSAGKCMFAFSWSTRNSERYQEFAPKYKSDIRTWKLILVDSFRTTTRTIEPYPRNKNPSSIRERLIIPIEW